MPANVIAAGGGFSDTVTLDVGSDDGIKPNETVLNGSGFVGLVTQVSANTSTVLLASDASSVVGVQLAGSGEIGAVTGTGKSLSGSGLLRLSLFDANAVLHPGQQVVTYASVGDKPQVPGVPVGTIVSVSGSAGALTQTAMVRPCGQLHLPRRGRRGRAGAAAQPEGLDPAAAGADGHRHRDAEPARHRVPGHAPPPPRDLGRLRLRVCHGRGLRCARLISVVVVAVTVVLQLTIVDRIAFPGGAGPDLVLLVVAALALAGGPLAGVLTGFWAGLALDVAPPGSHFIGQNALVFCLVGYACGLLADDSSGDAAEQGHTALFEIVVTAAGAVCGEALLALLGVMLSDPRVTWPAITNVLPAAVAYDVLLCPFVLYAVAAALRLAGARERGPAGRLVAQPGQGAGAGREPGRDQAAGRREHAAAAAVGAGQGAGLDRRPARPGRTADGREPQLKLGDPAAVPAGRRGVRPGRARRGRVQGQVRRPAPGGRARRLAARRRQPQRLRAARFRVIRALRGSRFGSSSMGRSLLGGSVFSRILLRAGPGSAARPLVTAPAPRHPAGGGWPGLAAPVLRGSLAAPGCTGAPAPVRPPAEVTGPGLAARRVLARPAHWAVAHWAASARWAAAPSAAGGWASGRSLPGALGRGWPAAARRPRADSRG